MQAEQQNRRHRRTLWDWFLSKVKVLLFQQFSVHHSMLGFSAAEASRVFSLEKSCTDCSYQSSHRLSNLFWVFVLFSFLFFFFFLGFTAMSSLKVPQAVPFSTRKQKIIFSFNVFYQEVYALSGCLAEQKFNSKHKLLPAFWPFIIFDTKPSTGYSHRGV